MGPVDSSFDGLKATCTCTCRPGVWVFSLQDKSLYNQSSNGTSAVNYYNANQNFSTNHSVEISGMTNGQSWLM